MDATILVMIAHFINPRPDYIHYEDRKTVAACEASAENIDRSDFRAQFTRRAAAAGDAVREIEFLCLTPSQLIERQDSSEE